MLKQLNGSKTFCQVEAFLVLEKSMSLDGFVIYSIDIGSCSFPSHKPDATRYGTNFYYIGTFYNSGTYLSNGLLWYTRVIILARAIVISFELLL